MRIEIPDPTCCNPITDVSDYTAESIASSLIKKGISPEKIILKSTGTSRRSFKKDVSTISSFPNDETDCHIFFLESPREGIYDTLPESIFHSFNGKNSVHNKESIKEDIKKHREDEKQARRFFLPFEQEFFNIKRTLFIFEDAFEWFSNASTLIDIFNKDYPILHDLPMDKAYLFIRLIPLIHEIRDDFTKVEECLSMLLDSNIDISTSFKKITINTYAPPALGSATLGMDTIIGSIIADGQADIDLYIEAIHPPTTDTYDFFNKHELLTKKLCDFFIGAQYDVAIHYIHNATKNNLVLNDNFSLGYNVYI